MEEKKYCKTALASFFCICSLYAYIILSIPAMRIIVFLSSVILAIISLVKIDKSNSLLSGRSLAKATLLMSFALIIFGIIASLILPNLIKP